MCTTDLDCRGYSIISRLNRCYIYTTSGCPEGWFLNNEAYTSDPITTIPSTWKNELGCYIKEKSKLCCRIILEVRYMENLVNLKFTTIKLWISGTCIDTNYGRTDRAGDTCDYYDKYPNTCGSFDDSDFTATSLCCACGGGRTGTLTTYKF